MASLHSLKSTLAPISISHSKCLPGRSDSRKATFRLKIFGGNSKRYFGRKNFRTFCAVEEEDSQSNGDELPESLFMRELKKRGMTPTSLLDDTNEGNYGMADESEVGNEEGDGLSEGNADSSKLDQSQSDQRETSMALNSEGLEGLFPRSKLLLTIGGTFFLGFWPLILITTACFYALYLYFGPDFAHDGSSMVFSSPQYVDPYELLEDEEISQIAPSLK